MRYGKTVVMAAAVALAVGCGKVDPFADATPDFDGVALEIQGGAAEGINQALKAPELAQSSSALTASVYFTSARAAVGELNAALLKILNALDYVVTHAEPSTSTADMRVYGPKDTANVTVQLTIKKLADGRFGWKLEAKPLGADDTAYVIVMAGSITKGDLPHRGHGVLGVDLDAYKTVDTAFQGQGKLLCGFAHVVDSKAVAYKLVGFTPDATVHAPVDARFVGYRQAATGFTAARLMSLTNVAPATDAKETVLSRVRYLPAVGGRLDFVAFGGDIAADRLYWGTACIDSSSGEVFKRLQVCDRATGTTTCVQLSSTGAIGSCPGQADQTPPSDDPNDGTMESGAPAGTETVTAPDTLPTVDGQ